MNIKVRILKEYILYLLSLTGEVDVKQQKTTSKCRNIGSCFSKIMTDFEILHDHYTLSERNYQLKIAMKIDAFISENDCVRLISQFVEKMDLVAFIFSFLAK